MGFFDKLISIAEQAKADAIADSKKTKGGAYPNSIKEQGYQAYKNSSEETRKNIDEKLIMTNYRERYENEKKK